MAATCHPFNDSARVRPRPEFVINICMDTLQVMTRPERSIPDPFTVGEVLSHSDVLLNLQRRLAESNERLQVVRTLLPEALSAQLTAGPVDDSGWTLIVRSSAIAAKVRQWQPLLEDALRQQGWQVSAIRVRIQSGR